MRGEDPRKIRVLDIRAPTRPDLTTGKAALVDFRIVDVSDAEAVRKAFNDSWPPSGGESEEITVFHTAANIRFFEHVEFLLPLSSRVNVQGVQNVLNAAREAGATVFISTSSGSIGVRRLRLWRWPWEWFKESLPDLVQLLDDGIVVPLEHRYFFSNYAYTKRLGEALVSSADKLPTGPQTSSKSKVIRTGCLRPGNGVFGPGGDVLCGAYLVRRNNPSWIHHVVQNFIYVENCSLAHLCYEARLLESGSSTEGKRNPDIGGLAFTITDPNPPPSYGDVYNALNAMTAGRTTFPHMSPTFMLTIAHIIEMIYLFRRVLVSSPLPFLARLLPRINGDAVNLQPSMFWLIMPHLLFSSRRASLSPSEGGLGYTGQWTTLEGLCKLVTEFEANGGKAEERQKLGGVSFGFGGSGLVKAERSVGKFVDEVENIEKMSERVLN